MPYVQQLSSIVEIFDWWLGVKFLCPGLGFSSSVILVVLYAVCLSSLLFPLPYDIAMLV